jgi:cysteine-S-conjugate beta-lyase
MKFATKLIHNGNEIDPITGAVSIPIYQASTFHQNDVTQGQEFDYSRSGNPTRKALESTIAILENSNYGFAFASGMAATSSVLSIFSKGDHIVVCEDVYGGTYRAVTKLFNRFGMEFSLIDASDPQKIEDAIQPNTKALFLETPSNPLLKITDIRTMVSIAKKKNLITMLDNTFMSPYLQRPIDLGIDIVIHSATKFLGGHSDVIGGLVVTNDKNLSEQIYRIQNGFGAVLNPQDSWLVLRGIKTLKVRMDYSQSSAIQIANSLVKLPIINKVYYPGLENHPNKIIHESQADGPGCVLSFEINNEINIQTFLQNLNIPAVAVSLGGVESILSYPIKMSHAAIPDTLRKKLGVNDRLFRLSVGLEDPNDLYDDIVQALEKGL